MKYHKLLLFLFFVMEQWVALSQTPAHVFITAGQSNAEGRESVEYRPPYLNDSCYHHLRYAFVRSAQTGRFDDFKFEDTFAFCDVTNYLIDRAMDSDFYAIKCTYGGTAIAPGATEPGKPIWYADRKWLKENKAHDSCNGGMSLTLSLTEGFAKCVETTLSKLSAGYDVKAILWHQGESDRNKAEDYYQNFKDMITFMRKEIHAVTGKEKDKTLPFIFGTVPHASRQHNPMVEAAQLKVAQELPNVYAIDLSDAVLRADELHFNGPWTEYVGKLMFNKLVELNLVDAQPVDAVKPTLANQLEHRGDLAGSLPFCLQENGVVGISICTDEPPIVKSAFEMVSQDLGNVLNKEVSLVPDEGNIIAGTMGKKLNGYCDKDELQFLSNSKEGFVMKVLPSGKLLIVGSDSHGTAYGLLELSRLMGVSPWEWWADAIPERKARFELPAGYSDRQAPSVEYRGIFINDEDWGLMPWSSMTMEPQNKRGIIGAKTTEQIFKLLLRLRANTYWPPMHECSEPFFLTPGNREVAEQYGIYIGSSHCEPMASSTAVEWGRRGVGEYDYVNNSVRVLRFWEERVKEVADQEIIYTLGMRGVHDGAMNGAKTVEEQKTVLGKAIADQRCLLSQYVSKNVTKVPQVFIPYKEVLDVYNAGLEVPEDVTLMWCDDNYGYIRHFPTAQECSRKGGNGIYYHVSYWGRPHDYLWLGTFSPYLLYQQMSEAYHRGIQKMWILNVGDIKPAEYQIELFMDMAWNMDAIAKDGVKYHLNNFLAREFGEDAAIRLVPLMNEHYRLAFIRKPEFLGNTRCEEYGPDAAKWNRISDLPWSDEYITRRLEDYNKLSDAAERINACISTSRMDTYFQLVKYPVQAAAEMNKKMLYAQLARHGKETWEKSDAAYDSIVALTRNYNTGIHNQGKWHGMMDCQPRCLPVFEPVDRASLVMPVPHEQMVLCKWNGAEYTDGKAALCEGLGYEGKAVMLDKDKTLSFDFENCAEDSVEVEIRLLPNHPVSGNQMRIAVCLDKKRTDARIVAYQAEGRSEEWKENVLRNQAIRRVAFPVERKKGMHRLTVTALDEGVILDQIVIRNMVIEVMSPINNECGTFSGV